MATMAESVNVFDQPLAACGDDPLTGYFRDGCCNTSDGDFGSHTVCVEISAQFLECSLALGNDLVTTRPELGFPGLKPGDRWCVCATRWLEAYEKEMEPRVYLQRTHKRAMEIIPLAVLKQFAADLN